MNAFMAHIAPGIVASFHRDRNGTIVLNDTAPTSDSEAYARIATTPPPADASPVPISMEEAEAAADGLAALVKTMPTGQALLDSVDATLLRSDTHAKIRALGFVDRTCRVCSKTFSITGTRDVCDEHAHLGESR